MAHKIELNDDDEYIDVALGGATVRVDLYVANNRYAALCDQHSDPEAQADAWVEWLVSQGLPRMSHRTAFDLADAVVGRVAELKKTPDSSSASADSPAPTA